MATIRLLWRLPILITITAVSYFGLLLLLPLRRLAPALQVKLRNRIFQFWARTLAATMGMRVTCEGTPPEGAFVLVSNHMSYMDIILIASRLDAAFVAKADLHGWPLLGRAFAAADTIFIDRGRRRDLVRVMDRMDAQLARGLGVVVFPEGTSGRGDEVLPFKPSLLQLAARDGRAVHWACIGYRSRDGQPKAEDAICWWGDAPFTPHIIGLLGMPGFDATLQFGSESVQHNDRKQLATALREAIQSHFTPVD